LQDHDRARVAGARSYGKGHAQELFPAADGAAVKLTTSEWLRPSGAPIERHIAGSDTSRGGVWPDSGLAMALDPEEHRRWSETIEALDQTIGFARGQGERPAPPRDPWLDRVVGLLAEPR
jgi:C-terminal processing protease CtpA/Prc